MGSVQPVRHRWLDTDSLLLRVAGLVALLSIPLKHPGRFTRGVDSLLPFHLIRTSHLASFAIGLGLLYLAGQVALRKRNSWYLAVSALGGLVVAELLHFRNAWQLGLYVVVLALLAAHRHQYVVVSDETSIRRGLLTAAGLFAVVLLFVVVVFETIDQQAFGRDLTTWQTLTITWNQLLGSGIVPADIRLLRYDRMLIDLLRVALSAMLVIVVASLFRPLKLRRRAPASHISYARELLANYSQSPEDFFKIWPADKHYYFYNQAFLAYGVANGVAIVLDGVSGEPEDVAHLRAHFLEYARINGWQAAIVHSDDAETAAWQQLGLKSIFIGSEALVDVDEFVTATSRSKHFRYVRNRATKDNLVFEVWQPPLTSQQLDQLYAVSRAWLGQGGRREYTFMMGYFDREYLGDCQVAVLKQAGQVAAYTNFIPVFVPAAASIDHTRSRPTVSGVAMHFLLMQTIMAAAERGAKSFNLGLAPLSQLDDKTDKNIQERLLGAIKRLGGRYYSFAGLEQFKGKFEPDWTPRYIVYQPGGVVPAMAALNALTAYRAKKPAKPGASGKVQLWLVAAAALAGLAFVSFPLAWLVNPRYADEALASHLGEVGQPYAWLFNDLDVLSGLLAIVVLIIAWRRIRPLTPSVRWLLVLAVASAWGTIMAAIISLPAGYVDVDSLHAIRITPQLVGHAFASLSSSGGFVVAAIIWAVHWRRSGPWLRWGRFGLAALIVLCATLGYFIGQRWPAVSPHIQHTFIALYAVWLPWMAADLLYEAPQRRKSSVKRKH